MQQVIDEAAGRSGASRDGEGPLGANRHSTIVLGYLVGAARQPDASPALHLQRWSPLVMLLRKSQSSRIVASIQFVVFCTTAVWIVMLGAEQMGYNWQWYNIPKYLWIWDEGEFYWGQLAYGLATTVRIALWGTCLTLVIGLATALLRMSNSLSGRWLATAYLELVRNTPLLVQLYLFYFVLAPTLGIDRFWTGVLCLAFYEAAFVAEIIRAGIESVDTGQWESGRALGLRPRHLYRRVVLPQAVPLMLPPLTGQIVNLIKHSAIVSVIAVTDLTTEGRNIIADTFMSFEVWFTIAGIYLVMTISLSLLVSWLEHRAKIIR